MRIRLTSNLAAFALVAAAVLSSAGQATAGSQVITGAECLPRLSTTAFDVTAGRITNTGGGSAWFTCPIHHKVWSSAGNIRSRPNEFVAVRGEARLFFSNGGFGISCYPVVVRPGNAPPVWGTQGTQNPSDSGRIDFPTASFPAATADDQYAIQCWLPPNARINLLLTRDST
jgi:hypothetical protein